ncbi:hypothetical protein DVH24_041849 [Malus domestica]|uniref:Uncharacterized protein n=1 Tax=Malus domestica TaxID=3750 RepID=A0A498IUJ6_MALDO|nr:hypothetical protein DVH24_041849 [Malus domestica]
MCCPSRVCMLCTCLILVVVLVGLLFGFGVFKNGFHKLKDTVNICDPNIPGSYCGSQSDTKTDKKCVRDPA